jgi:hypothetical protein
VTRWRGINNLEVDLQASFPPKQQHFLHQVSSSRHNDCETQGQLSANNDLFNILQFSIEASQETQQFSRYSWSVISSNAY